jgi:hypothetical protein
MRQLTEFTEQIRAAATQYVSAYLRDSTFRAMHLQVMRSFDAQVPQLAEAIDILLWERDQEVFGNIIESDKNYESWAPLNQ